VFLLSEIRLMPGRSGRERPQGLFWRSYSHNCTRFHDEMQWNICRYFPFLLMCQAATNSAFPWLAPGVIPHFFLFPMGLLSKHAFCAPPRKKGAEC